MGTKGNEVSDELKPNIEGDESENAADEGAVIERDNKTTIGAEERSGTEDNRSGVESAGAVEIESGR